MAFDPNTAQAIHSGFDPSTASVAKDERAGQFNPQLTKSMYEHLPFGKRIVQTLDPQGAKDVESTPPAQGFAGKAGEMAGSLLSFLPAFEAGGAITAPAKLAGGSIAVGGQSALEKANHGGSTADALKEGVESAAGTYVGGKVLEGAAKFMTAIPQGFRDTSGRIHDYLVRVPTKAFSYGKDPLGVMAKENITANTMADYESEAASRLEQRTQELNAAIKGSDAKVSLEDKIDSHIKQAQKEAEGSLQDRTELNNKLAEMRGRISTKYGNLDDIPVSKAVQLKRQIADDFPFSPMEAKSSTNNLLAQAAHKIHHSINDAIDVAAPDVAELNDRVSSLIDISKAARNRVAIESRNHPLGLIATIVGVGAAGAAAGKAAGQNPLETGLGAALLTKAASSPAVLTRVAAILSRMADVDKINLFKASPAFMDLAQKAHEFMGNPSLSEAGQAGSKATPVDAELVTPKAPPALPAPPKAMIRPDRALPSPKTAGQSSGPVIKQGPPKATTEDPSGFLAASKKKIGGTQIGNNQGIINIGEDPRKFSKEELQESLKHYENVALWSKNQADKSQLRDAQTMVAKIKNAISGVGKGPIGLNAAASAGTAAIAGARHKKVFEGQKFTGQASTYGWGEKGLNKTMADGEKFDSKKPFVAMSALPLGTRVEVKDLKTGKTIEVPVRDFGPGKRTHRVVDLSRGAWEQLGYKKAGLTNVTVTVKSVGTGRRYHGKY